MAKIVCVHGIAQQFKGERSLHQEWVASLRDGVGRTGPVGKALAAELNESDITFAFFGDAFRPPGQTLGIGDPLWRPDDLTAFEEELLLAWWREAAAVDPTVAEPDDRTMIRTARTVQTALRVLSGSAFFAGLAQRMMIGDLVQVRRYFTEPELRTAIQARVVAAVNEHTRVVVGHSLGSVVAYEMLCAHPKWAPKALVTLGSPLGIRNLVFDRLQPKPAHENGVPRGHWPGSTKVWTNVVDHGDVVALVKDLRPLFGDRVISSVVHNGSRAHDVARYLTAPETGKGIVAGLVETDG